MSATEIRRLINLLEGRKSLTEMPLPSDDMRTKVYYHGCKHEDRGRQILEHGIAPQVMDYHSPRGKLTPVANKVYLAQEPAYSLIYCLGGVWAGHEIPNNILEKDGRYGWLFVIDGKDLQDIQPDEDSVGAFLSQNAEPIQKEAKGWQGQTYMQTIGYQYKDTDHPENREKRMTWNHIYFHMTERQRKKSLDGYMADQAAGGKRVLKTMPDWMKLALIRWGSHIAHHGPIMPIQAWRIDKLDSPKYAKDGSNIFELAERVR